MGKLRRERHKYHLSRAKSTNGASVTPTENNEASKGESPESSALLPVPENLFAGVDISFDSLKQSLKDPDVRSVISKKSLSGGSLKSKKEKKKLRHEVFLKSKRTSLVFNFSIMIILCVAQIVFIKRHCQNSGSEC